MKAEILTRGDGTMKGARIDLHATTLANAYELASDFINPWLSYISFLCNCSGDIPCIKIAEVATGTVSYSLLMLGRGMTIQALPPFSYSVEIAALLAAYREGLNSLDSYWQFMSFWKVTEGVNEIRKRRYNPPTGIDPATDKPDERIPKSLSEFNSLGVDMHLMQPYLGQKFGKVRSMLEPNHRNAVAHLNPGRNPLTIDSASAVTSIWSVIPVIRYIAHEMIKYEIDRLSPNQGAPRATVSPKT
jgi:hypothetical protein